MVAERERGWLGCLGHLTQGPGPINSTRVFLGASLPPASLSLSKMATKEDQDTLRLLVQYVSRAFYEPKFTIIMDQLARNPV